MSKTVSLVAGAFEAETIVRAPKPRRGLFISVPVKDSRIGVMVGEAMRTIEAAVARSHAGRHT